MKWVGPAILLSAIIYMLCLSWFKWPHLIIDYGRELYVPWQITQGKVLYADINHLYGPLAQYLNAMLFQMFGVGLSTLAYFNIFLILCFVFIIYTILRVPFGPFVATMSGLCFIFIFAFSAYNYVCPYSHEVTYGIFLFFLTLLIFRSYLANHKLISVALLGLFMGLIFLTKVEVFLAAFASVGAGLLFMLWKRKPSHPGRHLLVLSFFFFIPVTVFFIYFTFHMKVADAFKSVIASYSSLFFGPIVRSPWYLENSGLDFPCKNIATVIMKSLGYILFVFFTGFVAWAFNRWPGKRLKYGWVLICILVFLPLFFIIDWLEIARPYPIILALILAYLIQDLVSTHDVNDVITKLPFAVFTLFSILLLLKIIFKVTFFCYGSPLAMPATMVITVAGLYSIPVFLGRWGSRKVILGLMSLPFLWVMAFYIGGATSFYGLKNYPVSQGRDRFFTFNPGFQKHGPVVRETLAYIDLLMSKEDTFVVMPEGVMINYLSRRVNPCRYFEFKPPFVAAMGEEKMIEAISRNLPSFVLIIDQNTEKHGARYFGKDYACDIYSFISERYERVCLIGEEPNTGNGFGIIIARKCMH